MVSFIDKIKRHTIQLAEDRRSHSVLYITSTYAAFALNGKARDMHVLLPVADSHLIFQHDILLINNAER